MKGKIMDTAHISNIDGKVFINSIQSQINRMQNLGLEVEVLYFACRTSFSAIILGREVNKGD